MTLDRAIKLIEESAQRMNDKYGAVLFDEWLVVQVGQSDRILAHSGPRGEDIIHGFDKDATPIGEVLQGHNTPGDFGFTHEGHGTRFDAFVILGKKLVLLWNKTDESTTQITKHPRWKIAQTEFVALTDLIRNDPVEY